jgi:hypothetical protein
MSRLNMKNFVMAAAFALAAPTWATAQDTTGGDDIVVTGTRLQEIVRDFVGEVSVAPGSENQLARWDRRICPGVIGLQNAQQAQYLVDRIAQRAQLVGVDAEGPGCRADVIVFVTPDSDRMAREIGQEYRQLVAYHSAANAVTQGQDELARFMEASRAVRWWHVSQTVTADGQVLGESNARPTSSGGFAGVEVVRQPDAGRLRRSTRQDFSRVIIIVDATRAAGVQFATLADYVAMAALAQIAPDADTTAVPTILSLFADREAGRTPPEALTDWDVAYLTGLYEAPRAARNSQAQEGAIARTMSEELTNPPVNP